jgi:hypothetical protein
MDRLRKYHEPALIHAIESVVTSQECSVAVRDEWIARINLGALMDIYFRLADELRYDTIPFIERLETDLRVPVLRAVFRIWGPGGYNRLNKIPMTLFRYFCEATDVDSHWVSVFNRYQRIGILNVIEA